MQAPNDVYYCGAIGYVIRAYANVRRTEEIIKVLRDLAQDQDNALTDTKARIIAKNLLICLQADLTSREFINANSYLLERAAREPSFPKEVLAVIYRMRGQAYTALHEYRQAIQDLNQAIALYDKDAFEYICRGIASRLLGDYQHAIEDFGTALTKNPNSTQVYAERGLAYRHISQYAEALADFNAAITFNSKSSWVYGQRGKVHRLLKNYSQAVEDFNNAISLDAQDAWAYAQRGLAFLWMKDLAQAKSDYVHSQEIDTKNISYSWVSTWIEMCLQRDDVEAIKQLETLAAADQPDYLTLVCQGVTLWLQSNFDKALVTLGQAVLLEPHRWDVHFWKGMTLASLEKDEEAIHGVKQALELGLPPVLLAPLKWFEQSRPAFYQTSVPLLLEHQGVN